MTDTIDATPLGSLARLEPICTRHPVLRLLPKRVRANIKLDVENVRRALSRTSLTRDEASFLADVMVGHNSHLTPSMSPLYDKLRRIGADK
jgi:hypothetical protein